MDIKQIIKEEIIKQLDEVADDFEKIKNPSGLTKIAYKLKGTNIHIHSGGGTHEVVNHTSTGMTFHTPSHRDLRLAKKHALEIKNKSNKQLSESDGTHIVKMKSPFSKLDHYVNLDDPRAQIAKRHHKHATPMSLEKANDVAKYWKGGANKWETEVVPLKEEIDIQESSGMKILTKTKQLRSRQLK